MEKKIINSNMGLNNVVKEEDLAKAMHKTLATMEYHLKDHCGPLSSYAIQYTDDSLGKPVFTQDGKKIIGSIEFASPLEKMIQSMVLYIAERIEDYSGDGTTSSMFITISILKTLRKFIDNNPEQRMPLALLNNCYKSFVDDMHKAIDNFNVSVDIDDPDFNLVRNIAYSQAYTSSHCDEDLAEKVAEIFASKSPIVWDYITFESTNFESDFKYKVQTDDSDISFRGVNIYKAEMANSKDGTECVGEGYRLETYIDPIIPGSTFYNDFMDSFTEACKNDKKVVYFLHNQLDGKMISEFDTQLYMNRVTNVKIFRSFDFDDPSCNPLKSLAVTLGLDHNTPYKENICVDNISFKFDQHALKFYNLLEYPEDYDSELALNYHNESFQSYVKEIKNTIDIALFKSSAQGTDLNVGKYVYTLNSILTRSNKDLILGGNVLDIKASFDVAEDVLKSVRAALTKGVSLGGYRTLLGAVKSLNYNYVEEKKTLWDKLFKSKPVPLGRISEDTKEIRWKSMFKQAYEEAIFNLNEVCGISKDLNYDCNMDIVTGEVRSLRDLNSPHSQREVVITQPTSVDHAMLDRFGEVGMKFLLSSSMIVENGIYLNEDKQ